MSYKLPWQAYALTPWDRILLYGTGPENGGLGFKKGSGDERADSSEDFRNNERPADWGKVTKIAKRFVAGEYGAATYFDVAEAEKVDSGSLKNTIWRLRNTPSKEQKQRISA